MCQNSPNKSFFRVRILPRCYVRFCKIGSMERQKRITFKKKFIKKQLFVEEICHFQEQNVWNFHPNLGYFQREINENWRSRKSIFIDFPLEMSRILEENPHFFALENNISPRQIIVFWKTFFWKLFFFDAPSILFYRIWRNVAEACELGKIAYFRRTCNFCWRELYEIRESPL